MTILKVFCFCFTPKTGSLVLGSVGVILSILMIVPPCLILESHDFYFNEYIRQQKSYGGVDIRDEDIPGIKLFNKVSLSSFVAYLVIFTFASILMISGVAARRSFLLIPWLVVSFLTLLFFLIMSISAMFAIANIKALVVLFPAGVPLGFGIYFWIAVYSTFLGLRNEETAKMVRAAIRPDGVNANTTGNSTANMTSNTSSEEIAVVNSSAETEETEVCSTQRPSIPISHSSPTFMHFKDNSSQRGQRAGSPPPPYETVAVDINKEEEALRSGIERSALALKSRLEQPLMMKNDSMDSNGSSSDDASACTTQPLDAIMLAPPSTSCAAVEQADDQPLLLDAISFSSASSKDLKSPQVQVNIEASIIVENSDVAKC